MATQTSTRKRSAATNAQTTPQKWPEVSALAQLDPATRADVAQEVLYILLGIEKGDNDHTQRFEEFTCENELLRELATKLQVPYMLLRLQADEYTDNPEVSEADIVEWITWHWQHEVDGLPDQLQHALMPRSSAAGKV